MSSARLGKHTDCSITTRTIQASISSSFIPIPPLYSVRVGISYRAVGVRDGAAIVWYWIGSHASYEQLLAQA
jgi:hypothetical protein